MNDKKTSLNMVGTKDITFNYPDGSYTRFEFSPEFYGKDEVYVRGFSAEGTYSDGVITKKQALSQIKKLTKTWKKSL